MKKIVLTFGVEYIIQAMQKNEIEDYENIKFKLAKKIKIVMQKDQKWGRVKQKALKRKVFIESILAQSDQ